MFSIKNLSNSDEISHVLVRGSKGESTIVMWGKGLDFISSKNKRREQSKKFLCQCSKHGGAKKRGVVCPLCFEEVSLREAESVFWMERVVGLIFAALSIFHYIGASTEINSRKSELALQNYPKLHKAAIWIRKFCENNYLYGLRPRRKEFYVTGSEERLPARASDGGKIVWDEREVMNVKIS